MMMRKILLALSGAAVALTVAPAPSAQAKTYVCTKWDDGVCVSTKRVKGTPPRAVGYVFGPNYTYTTIGDLPGPAVTYYKLGDSNRYVYSDGYIYVIDPATYAVTRVIDTLSR
jgi:hypothetical protein